MASSSATPEHHTTDLDSAAFAVTRGQQLIRVERAANGRSTFVFPASAQQDIAAFYAGALVKAIDFGGALKMVKKAMFDSRLSTTHENNHADARYNR